MGRGTTAKIGLRRPVLSLTGGLLLALAALVFGAVMIGPYGLSPAQTFAALLGRGELSGAVSQSFGVARYSGCVGGGGSGGRGGDIPVAAGGGDPGLGLCGRHGGGWGGDACRVAGAQYRPDPDTGAHRRGDRGAGGGGDVAAQGDGRSL